MIMYIINIFNWSTSFKKKLNYACIWLIKHIPNDNSLMELKTKKSTYTSLQTFQKLHYLLIYDVRFTTDVPNCLFENYYRIPDLLYKI